MSHFNQHLKAPNPSYPLTYAYEYDYPDMPVNAAFPGFVFIDSINCPTVTNCASGGGTGFKCEGVPEVWGFAVVTEVYGTRYAANVGLPDYKESKAKGKVCYPTDANSIDKDGRDSSDGACYKNGKQDLVCNGDKSKCLSKESSKCECQYDDIPNGGKGVGQWIADYGEGDCGKIR
jgi:hypothetical protein